MDTIPPGVSTISTTHSDIIAHARQPPADDTPAAKARLRRRILLTRRTFPLGPAERAGSAIARRLLDLPEVAGARCVAAFVSLADEPDTSELLATLRRRGIRVLLPAIRADLDLDFREYTGVLVPGAMGTFEPPPAGPVVRLGEADVVIAAALAADRAGRRLGRGGGSYDRALAAARSTALTIAVVFDHELLDELPYEAHDRRVRVVVTPRRAWRCPDETPAEPPG